MTEFAQVQNHQTAAILSAILIIVPQTKPIF